MEASCDVHNRWVYWVWSAQNPLEPQMIDDLRRKLTNLGVQDGPRLLAMSRCELCSIQALQYRWLVVYSKKKKHHNHISYIIIKATHNWGKKVPRKLSLTVFFRRGPTTRDDGYNDKNRRFFPRHIGDSLDQASITADPRRTFSEPIKHLGSVEGLKAAILFDGMIL